METESRVFPDGEVYVRLLDDVKGSDVAIVQTTYPNDKLVELLFLLDAAHDAGAASITAVVPYYAYSRQDQRFHEGEAVSAKAVARLLEVHADRVVTVDPHKEHILGFYAIEARSASAVPELAAAFADEGVDLVLAPDKGALERAERAARILGVESDFLEKTRLSGERVEMAPKNLDVAGRTVAIVDDIISTGGTIATAAGELKRQDARRVIAACTHGLFIKDAATRMRDAGCDVVIATNTIEGDHAVVSAAPAIARALR